MAGQRIFKPLQVGNVQLEHRITMAPLTRMRADANHVPSEHAKTYYGQRASTKGTLLVTEATFVSARAGGYRYVPGLWSDAQVAGWKEVTDAVHKNGSFIFAQIWALGRVADPAVLKEDGFHVQSASNIPSDADHATPEPLTKEEIKAYVQDFAQAARNAIKAGFDGVEVHGANGYLIDQFWQDVSNDRTDEYGGSIENRARFGLEVTRAVIDAVGDSKKVAIRLSPSGKFQAMGMKDPVPQFSYIVQELSKLNLAYLSLIEGRKDGSAKPDAEYEDLTRENDPYIQIWGKDTPIMLAGGFGPTKAYRVTDDYYPDHQIMIAFGRYFISTPDIAQRMRDGVELNKWDRTTFYGGNHVGYTDYPFASEVAAKA